MTKTTVREVDRVILPFPQGQDGVRQAEQRSERSAGGLCTSLTPDCP